MAIARQSKPPFSVKFLVHELGELRYHISSAKVLFTDTSDNTACVEIDGGDFFVYWPNALVKTLSASASSAAESTGTWMPKRMKETHQATNNKSKQ
ncbi:hypothetical protein F6Q06_08515 [Pectobacterium parmentieri]|uniref:Uncharacterized protein n=1 Tax=Pectobacterium parmentieri TaxID=1905730 RepID=A0ABS0RY19_PECPM|nr:hypothetical protein [Pectobacterium parmentieri]MBI0554532.1 hypothetical protein [Pectobacterium parmentieri]